MNDLSIETALLLRARQIAENLAPSQIRALLVLSAASPRAAFIDEAVFVDLRRHSCVLSVREDTDPSHSERVRCRLDAMGELVTDVLNIEGRVVPEIGKLVRSRMSIRRVADDRIFAFTEGGSWRVAPDVTEIERRRIIDYFPDVDWVYAHRTTRLDLQSE